MTHSLLLLWFYTQSAEHPKNDVKPVELQAKMPLSHFGMSTELHNGKNDYLYHCANIVQYNTIQYNTGTNLYQSLFISLFGAYFGQLSNCGVSIFNKSSTKLSHLQVIYDPQHG